MQGRMPLPSSVGISTISKSRINLTCTGSNNVTGGMDKSKSSTSTNGPFVPAEMKRRDKIIRTPIDPELLDQIRRENVSLSLDAHLVWKMELQKNYDLIKPTKKSTRNALAR